MDLEPFPRLWDDVPAAVNEMAREAIGVAIEIHREIGPGVAEKVYKLLLADRLRTLGHAVEVEREVPLEVAGVKTLAYRADIVLDGVLLIELKGERRIAYAHVVQVKTYLRLGRYPLGLLLNFHAPALEIKRVVP